MEVVRRNTDYAIRLIVNMAESYGSGPKSARELATQEEVAYELACKLLQRLACAGFVKSVMGPKGGFILAKRPEDISLLEVMTAIQGPVILNKCTRRGFVCHRLPGCAVNKELLKLQKYVEKSLSQVKLDSIGICNRQQHE